MKVTRAYIGQYAEVVWRDPLSSRYTSSRKDGSDIPRGRQILAYQEEIGMIDDVTDGVLRIRHTRGIDSDLVPEPSTDYYCTWVPEELVEKITLLKPQQEGQA